MNPTIAFSATWNKSDACMCPRPGKAVPGQRDRREQARGARIGGEAQHGRSTHRDDGVVVRGVQVVGHGIPHHGLDECEHEPADRYVADESSDPRMKAGARGRRFARWNVRGKCCVRRIHVLGHPAGRSDLKALSWMSCSSETRFV